jgi:serine/threonine-protein kinase
VAELTDRPRRLGRYEIEALIGAGAMGHVYRARDPAVGRPVAIKTVKPEHADRPRVAEYVQRFQREARAAGALNHPNIVSVYDVGEDFLVMELLEGVDLAEHLERNGPFELPEAIALFASVADAIDTAHASGVIHRDLKPANIMLLADGRPKLMDFGVARLESSAMTRTGEVLGSPSYMSPEQVAGRQVDTRADVYSLGVVLYQALTGQRPFQGDTITTVIFRVVNEPAPSPRHWRPDLPEALDGVFEKALAKDPADRFGSARALVEAIANAAGVELADFSPAIATAPPRTAPPMTADRAELETAIIVDSGELFADAAGETLGSDAEETRLDALPATPAPPRHRGLPVRAGVLGLLALVAIGAAFRSWLPVEPSRLSVSTSPPGAAIQLDGAQVGVSPLSFVVEPGSHELRLVLEGHAPATLRLDVRAGEQPAPLELELAPTVGYLDVVSAPPGADVFVDSERMGSTPLSGASVDPGRLDVLVNLAGVGSWRRTIEVKAGERVELDAVLEPVAATHPGPDENGVWNVGPRVSAPRRISGDPASYPEIARRARREGLVTVELIVTEKGLPVELEVVESAGAILDDAVLDAVADWRFEAAEHNGQKVRVRWHVRQRFQLTE